MRRVMVYISSLSVGWRGARASTGPSCCWPPPHCSSSCPTLRPSSHSRYTHTHTRTHTHTHTFLFHLPWSRYCRRGSERGASGHSRTETAFHTHTHTHTHSSAAVKPHTRHPFIPHTETHLSFSQTYTSKETILPSPFKCKPFPNHDIYTYIHIYMCVCVCVCVCMALWEGLYLI